MAENKSLQGARLSPADVLAAHHHARIDPPTLPMQSAGYINHRIARVIASDLGERLERKSYRPAKGYEFAHPKRKGFRMVTLMSPHDATVYAFLTNQVRPFIEKMLCPTDTLFGPRGVTVGMRWWSFEHSVLEAQATHIVMADVQACYPSISHDCLETSLARANCPPQTIEALGNFLGKIMGTKSGFPSPYDSTDILATASLDSVDHIMRRRTKRYSRCSDDFRIAADGLDEAYSSLEALEKALSQIGLTLQPKRTQILALEDYRRMIRGTSGRADRLWELGSGICDGRLLFSDFVRRIRHGYRWVATGARRREQAHELLRAAGRPALSSSGNSPQAPPFGALVHALATLLVKRDNRGLDVLGPLLHNEPALTPFLARYLAWALTSSARRVGFAAVEAATSAERPLGEAQLAWVFRALESAAAEIPAQLHEFVRDRAHSETAGWAARVEAARLLARRAEWGRKELEWLATEAPDAFHWEINALAAGDFDRRWSAGHRFI